MKLTQIGKMAYGAQDGAIWGDFAFRFNANGDCRVFDARPLDNAAEDTPVELPLLASFAVNPAEPLVPHFNAVVFGTEYFAEGDEFPLLYANIYNNYAKAEDRLEGTCCVYRLTREDLQFSMELVQVIRIGFTKDPLWISEGDKPDVRPYGNFVIDRDKNLLHVFTMRDAEHKTRYFSFRLPKRDEGELCEAWGVPVVTLGKEDILQWFDTDYHLFIQGACCHGGLVYSCEGFNKDVPPSLRVIDPAAGVQLHAVNLVDLGYEVEAEWMDFRGDVCYYSDAHGNIFAADFDA